MIWNQHLLYQIIDVWYHIRKVYLINNVKNDKIKLNHFFYKRRPIPFPPKFNVPFYIVLCTISFTFCVCHLSFHSRSNVFAFNIQLWFKQHSSFRFRHSTFHKQLWSFKIRLSSSVECTFIFSHPTFSTCPLSFGFRHLTLGIVLVSFRIWHSTFRIAGQGPMEIMGSINLTQPIQMVVESRSRDSQWSGLGRPSPLPTGPDVDNR